MMKRFMTIFGSLALLLTLTQCSPPSEEEQNSKEGETPMTQDSAAILDADIAAISLPAETQTDLALPQNGAMGSRITWFSDRPDVISTKGMVTPPDDDTDVNVHLTATFSHGDMEKQAGFTLLVRAEAALMQNSGLGAVTLSDAYLLNAEEKDIDYLLYLNAKKFLFQFYRTADLLTPTITGYGGWEADSGNQWNFRGHMFGHYMSALSQAYASGKRKDEVLKQIRDAVEGLKECQDAYAEKNPESAGYISGFPEFNLDIVEGSLQGTQNVWVPWYNLHKVLAGLLDIHNNVRDNDIRDLALEVASGFGEYIYNRTSKLENKNTLLGTEYGGMNEALYELYRLTGNEHHKAAAECFDETGLFQQMANGKDILGGKHANTTIPKLTGALKRYTVLSQNEEYYNRLTEKEKNELPVYLQAAVNFFDIVTENHTYVTGGNSQGEHFRASGKLGQFAHSETTCETCNTYNMLKLSQELYKLTRDKKYADYYENTFINAILASQNPETGMVMYFQPMGAGYNKVFSEQENRFWCCMGTGIENFTKLGGSLYYVSGASVYVNLYFSSAYTYERRNLVLTQSANLPGEDRIHLSVDSLDGGDIAAGTKLLLRVPDWSGTPVVLYNGEALTPELSGGYILLRDVKKGDTIELQFPMEVVAYPLPDTPQTIAFKYGPTVLCALLGDKDMQKTAPNGVAVLVSVRDNTAPQTITLEEPVADWMASLPEKFKRIEDSAEGAVRFALQDADNAPVYTPYYSQYKERYGIYMTFSEATP